jgi:hypothetical protein
VRRIALIITLIVVPLSLVSAPAATASERGSTTIETQKPFGPSAGTFSASGAISDSGTFANSAFTFSASGAPTFVIVHVVQEFDGALGTFRLRADIKESVTEDPNILTDAGVWVIEDGTGVYADLRGQGRITGTADENAGIISRTYSGTVHFD